MPTGLSCSCKVALNLPSLACTGKPLYPKHLIIVRQLRGNWPCPQGTAGDLWTTQRRSCQDRSKKSTPFWPQGWRCSHCADTCKLQREKQSEGCLPVSHVTTAWPHLKWRLVSERGSNLKKDGACGSVVPLMELNPEMTILRNCPDIF